MYASNGKKQNQAAFVHYLELLAAMLHDKGDVGMGPDLGFGLLY